jgi:hypothetical protein
VIPKMPANFPIALTPAQTVSTPISHAGRKKNYMLHAGISGRFQGSEVALRGHRFRWLSYAATAAWSSSRLPRSPYASIMASSAALLAAADDVE